MLTYRFQVTPDLHYQATRAVNRRSRARQIFQAAFVILPFIMVAVAVAQGWPVLDAVLTNLPWFILMWGLVFVVLPWIQRRQIFTYHKTTPSLGGEQTYLFDHAGLHMSGVLTNTDLRWEALTQVVETSRFFLFYFAKDFAYFLPQDAIGGDDEKERLRALVATHMRGRTLFRQPNASDISAA